MGEIADAMLDGTLCQSCGDYLGTDNGYPTECASCAHESQLKYLNRSYKRTGHRQPALLKAAHHAKAKRKAGTLR